MPFREAAMPFFKENKTILAKKYPKTCKIEKNRLPLQRFWDDESRKIRIVLWCNGSTAVFGSACLGSNPGKTTKRTLQGVLFPLYALA